MALADNIALIKEKIGLRLVEFPNQRFSNDKGDILTVGMPLNSDIIDITLYQDRTGVDMRPEQLGGNPFKAQFHVLLQDGKVRAWQERRNDAWLDQDGNEHKEQPVGNMVVPAEDVFAIIKACDLKRLCADYEKQLCAKIQADHIALINEKTGLDIQPDIATQKFCGTTDKDCLVNGQSLEGDAKLTVTLDNDSVDMDLYEDPTYGMPKPENGKLSMLDEAAGTLTYQIMINILVNNTGISATLWRNGCRDADIELDADSVLAHIAEIGLQPARRERRRRRVPSPAA